MNTRIYLINDPYITNTVLIKTSDCIHDAFDHSFILFIFCCFRNDHEIVLTIPNPRFLLNQGTNRFFFESRHCKKKDN
jgi:hypothetical protein